MSPTVLQECNPKLVDCFLKPGACITHNATYPPSDLSGGNLLDYMQPPLEPQNTLYYFFHMYRSSPPDTCTTEI